jgi:hypothetical protein
MIEVGHLYHSLVDSVLTEKQKFQRSHDDWNMHMQGLERVVHMRGGLSSLESKPLILSKLYRLVKPSS